MYEESRKKKPPNYPQLSLPIEIKTQTCNTYQSLVIFRTAIARDSLIAQVHPLSQPHIADSLSSQSTH
jgi:hypothetical protein